MAVTFPTISIIIATYNCARTVRRAIESVLSQTLAVELLVADGGSSDDTYDIVRDYSDRIAWSVSERDRGVFDAWNKALQHATGEWVAFLGADDWLEERTSLDAAGRTIASADGRTLFVYGSVKVIGERQAVLRTDNAALPDLPEALARGMPITHVGTLHRKAMFDSYGLFDPGLRIAGDYDLMLRVCRRGTAIFCAGFRICMQDGGLSNSAEARVRLIQELLFVRRRHGVRWTARVDGYLRLKLLYWNVAMLCM